MVHFPYRNFGSHETLVGNFAVDVGSDKSGIRWFELRKSGAAWTLFQEGTFDPDTNHHFMGSIAMDGDGNIALGYSVSSSSMFPAIRYTTRLASDPPGTFGSEAVLIDGGGSQTGTNRWGDYSSMSIDPVDDCTFWYTNEYYPVSSPRGWHTRVGAFLIPGCGGPSADLSIAKSASPDPLVAPGAALTYTLTITNSGPLGIITDTATLTDNLPSRLSVLTRTCPPIGAAAWSDRPLCVPPATCRLARRM
jgi:uncharacterized repeat protein (TIGR01451 family)